MQNRKIEFEELENMKMLIFYGLNENCFISDDST